jgi:HK97 family phage major capsid protein
MTMHTAPGRYRVKDTSRADDHIELKSVLDALEKRDAEIKTFAEKASAEIKSTGQMATETKAALEKLSAGGAELSDRLMAVEQKLARRSVGGMATKSVGERFVESDGFKSLIEGKSSKAQLSVKATITSATTDAAGSVGDAIVADRQPGIVADPNRQFTIRNLLLPGRTASNAIEYVEEVGFTNSAATVAEGAARAQSDLQFELKTSNVRAIGHWFAASREVLADVPQLMSYINGRALYGLKYAEETQLLKGNGTGTNLKGILQVASAYKESIYTKSGDTVIDTIRRAILQCRVAEYAPTFVVLNPIDWCDIEMTKDSQDRYLLVPIPTTGADMRIWRLAVVETNAMTSGEFLVGATMGGQVFDREDAMVEVSTEHAEFFTTGLVAIKAEERLGLVISRPESFVHGQFSLGDSPTVNA